MESGNPVYRKSFIVILLLTLVVSLWAQSVGTVQGTVTDPTGAVVPGAKVTITSAVSGYSESAITDAHGFYQVSRVPFGQFTVHIEAPGFDHTDKQGELRTNVPVFVNAQMNIASTQQQITVSETASVLETTSAATHEDVTLEEIAKLPTVQSNRAIQAVVAQSPGVATDDNGRMHVRGSESQVQYVVDGVPITEQTSATFSTPIDAGNLRSAEVLTGNIPAEYGGKLGAVIAVNTKSGLDMPWGGSLSVSGGSFGNVETGLDFGGHTKKTGIFLSADWSRSDRYLDPPEIENFHNTGNASRLFGKFDWQPTTKDTFRFNFSVNGANFEVPNRIDQQLAGANVQQELRDDSQSVGYTHIFNDTTVFDAVAYRRSNQAKLFDNAITGFPFWAEQNRRQRTEGFRLNLSKELKWNSLKFGFQFDREPLHEGFQLAATDPAILADPTNPASQFPVSAPFIFVDGKTGHELAAYAQDRIKFKNLTVDVGLRYDHYNIVRQDDAWSPRIGVAYYIKKTGTVVRGSFNKLFQTPPNENLLLSSSDAATVLNPLAAAVGVRAVPAERQKFYEIGVQQQIWKYLRLDVSHYIKNIRNFSDKDQFLDTGVIFPVAIARGDVRGTEVRLDTSNIRGWSAFLSYANSKAVGTTPLVGGLFLDVTGGGLLTPGVQFPADHDVRNEGQVGVTYTHKRSGAWFTVSARHDSGVPTGFDPSTFLTLDPRIQGELDLVKQRVKPRTTADLAVGIDMLREKQTPLSLQLSVNNLFNEFYLYNFESTFSGTHFGRPREIVGRVVFHFKQRKSNP